MQVRDNSDREFTLVDLVDLQGQDFQISVRCCEVSSNFGTRD